MMLTMLDTLIVFGSYAEPLGGVSYCTVHTFSGH